MVVGEIDDPDEPDGYTGALETIRAVGWTAFTHDTSGYEPWYSLTFCPDHTVAEQEYRESVCEHRYRERGDKLVCERCGKVR